MRMTNILALRNLLAGLLMGSLAVPVLAQQNQQSRSGDQRSGDQRSGSQRDSQAGGSQQRQNQQQRQDGRSQSQLRVRPEGWVQMAVDYDNDGRYDGLETIYIYDLRMAQERSRSRRSQQQSQQQQSQQQRSQQQQSRQRDSQGRSQQARRSSATRTISGQVQDMKRITMRGADGQFMVARVQTDDGRTDRVLLGKQDQISQLNLQDGDKIRVQGRSGRVNDKPILVANRVSSGNQAVQVQISRSNQPLRQFRGEVVQTRTMRFRNRNEEFLVAQLRPQNGEAKTVNMGPKSKFSNVDLRSAGEVSVLAATGKINGRDALIAEEVSVNGRSIKIKPDQRRDQRWSSSGSQSQSGSSNRGSSW